MDIWHQSQRPLHHASTSFNSTSSPIGFSRITRRVRIRSARGREPDPLFSADDVNFGARIISILQRPTLALTKARGKGDHSVKQHIAGKPFISPNQEIEYQI